LEIEINLRYKNGSEKSSSTWGRSGAQDENLLNRGDPSTVLRVTNVGILNDASPNLKVCFWMTRGGDSLDDAQFCLLVINKTLKANLLPVLPFFAFAACPEPSRRASLR
jgi:hypothetical protein